MENKTTGHIIADAVGFALIGICVWFRKFELAVLIVIMNNIVILRLQFAKWVENQKNNRQIIAKSVDAKNDNWG